MRLTETLVQDEYGLRPGVLPGDYVIDRGWRITLTEKGIACDCGKALYCPLNEQKREPRW